MSVESFDFENNNLRIQLGKRRHYGQPDEYDTFYVDNDLIQQLPAYDEKSEDDWLASAGSGESTVPDLSTDSVWFPFAKCYVKFVSVFVRNYHSRGPGDGHEYIHGPFRVNGPPPPSVSFLSDSDLNRLRISLINANNELLETIRCGSRSLDALSSREFEELVAAILRNHGYKVELTKRTQDGGYDVFALAENPFGLDLRLIVECKRYNRETPVGISVVRQLWGTMNTPGIHADRGIIATTSRLSQDAAVLLNSIWNLSAWESVDILRFAGFKEAKGGLWRSTVQPMIYRDV
ncbi:MAG: restriction endonuclease [Thermodesulfovibrionales bacterium]|jgi:hypothetical protein